MNVVESKKTPKYLSMQVLLLVAQKKLIVITQTIIFFVHGTTPVLAVLSLMQFAMQHSLTE
jgi:hypothetical protein